MAIRKPAEASEKSAAMAELLAGTGKESTFKSGSIVEGTVSAVKGDTVFTDIGYKSEGEVSLDEFSDPAEAVPGHKFNVMIIALEDDRTGMLKLSKRSADAQIRWKMVQERYVEGCVVKGTIRSKVNGGLIVDVDGVEAFLPGSQLDVVPIRDLAPYIGQTYDFKVIKISSERRNVIISRRELIEGTMAEKKAELLSSLAKGEIRKGKVKNITDFGAFIDLDGIDGLLHITDMSWGRIKHPSELLKVGQELDVMVLDVDQDRERISLGLRQLSENPWDTIAEQFPKGTHVKGKVVNLAAYGAFVELEEGIDGMIHVSDMSWTRKINHPSECLEKGKEVEAIVLEVNPQEQRISLGLKQASQDPWSEIASKYKVGQLVKGKVSKIASFGAFIELEDGVDGLVHISQISDDRVEKVKDVLQVGQEVEARVVKVDRNERRIGLSIRAVNMTEDEVKALSAEADAESADGSAAAAGSESFGGLGAAFDEAFQNVEWQPGEAN